MTSNQVIAKVRQIVGDDVMDNIKVLSIFVRVFGLLKFLLLFVSLSIQSRPGVSVADQSFLIKEFYNIRCTICGVKQLIFRNAEGLTKGAACP